MSELYVAPAESSPDAEPLAYALERAMAELVERFRALPDTFLWPADVTSAALALTRAELDGRGVYETRDGRRVPALHGGMPSFRASQQGAPSRYDVAILHPTWVQGHDLAQAANLGGAGARAWVSLPKGGRPFPFLAVLNLRLVDELAAAPTTSLLLDDLNRLALASDEAVHRYMGIFCRNWDLDGQIRKTVELFGRWAARHRRVSLVVLQSYHDDIGSEFAGRYFNTWEHMAPLSPVEPEHAYHPGA
jgi:hypothetical protein